MCQDPGLGSIGPHNNQQDHHLQDDLVIVLLDDLVLQFHLHLLVQDYLISLPSMP
jgi:hypothetical protein